MSPEALKSLPPVQDILSVPSVHTLVPRFGRDAVLNWIRQSLDVARREISALSATDLPTNRAGWVSWLVEHVGALASQRPYDRLDHVINATGVVLHTGLGRAPLSSASRQALAEMGGHCNVEIDLRTGGRRYRGHQVEASFRTLTGCEDVLIVNNNAAATLLTLQSLCAGRDVIISRGQLIEIGGSFRLPEIFELSGAVLREVGTTNRTHLSDYERVVTPLTGAVMHVHPSNYRVIGFSETVAIRELAALAHRFGVIAIDDIGSGALVDVTPFGLPEEPTFQNSLSSGADLVLGSGDKLLGGPQCGIILGRHDLIERIRNHPLARAVRVGKLTLAALQATLDAYLRGTATTEIPTLAMLSVTAAELRVRAERIREQVGRSASMGIEIADDRAAVGGGALPGVELPTTVLRLRSESKSAEVLSRQLRLGEIRVMSRVQHDDVVLNLRSVLPEDDSSLATAVKGLLG